MSKLIGLTLRFADFQSEGSYRIDNIYVFDKTTTVLDIIKLGEDYASKDGSVFVGFDIDVKSDGIYEKKSKK